MDCLSNLSCLDIRIERAIDKCLRSWRPSRFLCWWVCALVEGGWMLGCCLGRGKVGKGRLGGVSSTEGRKYGEMGEVVLSSL